MLLLAALPACDRRAALPERRLPSGRVVREYRASVDGGGWSLFYRSDFTVAARERGPLQCEIDAIWSDLRAEAEAAGATRATFAPTHFEMRPRLVGWRVAMVGDITVFLELERGADGAWKKTDGWTAEQCGHGAEG